MKSFAELSGVPLSVLQSVKRPLRLPGGKREARPRAEALEEMGIISVLDLLTHYPRRYLDRTTQMADWVTPTDPTTFSYDGDSNLRSTVFPTSTATTGFTYA